MPEPDRDPTRADAGKENPKDQGQEASPARTPAEEHRVEDDSLESHWDDILGPRPETIEQRLIKEFGTQKGRLTICTESGRAIVSIDADGTVTFGEGYTPNEAAEVFWTNMALKRVGMEQRLQHFAVMEATLVRLGRATINYQQRLLASEAPSATPQDRQQAELARMSLNSLVASLTDYAAGLATRPIESTGTLVSDPTPPRADPSVLTPPTITDPSCHVCGGSGRILGDCGDSPNVWYDPCPTCRPDTHCLGCRGTGWVRTQTVVDGRPALETHGMPCPTCRPRVDRPLPQT
jgi:hypothetical protein